jgi:hypothetical protein
MIEHLTFWRRFGGLLAVVLAFALMFAPVAEAAVCADDPPVTAAAAQMPENAVAPADPSGVVADTHGTSVPNGGDDLGLCQHGHCHHVAPYIPIVVSEVVAHATASTPTHRLANEPPLSRASSRLDRPPRV